LLKMIILPKGIHSRSLLLVQHGRHP
jgi:hypothetical protein